MRRGKFSLIRSSFLAGLAAFFLYSASIQEVHYIFVEHPVAINDHCDNHLHSKEGHADCSLCKIDLSSFVQTFAQFELPKQIFSTDGRIYNLLDVYIEGLFTAVSLRGPPAIL